MPFAKPWSERVWKRHVKPAIEGTPCTPPLVARRADDVFGPDVMIDVFESIMRAYVIVADITDRNANVFYELGIAHTLGKRVLILSQGREHIPFDLQRFRHILYEDNSDGCAKLEADIARHLDDILKSENSCQGASAAGKNRAADLSLE